MVEKVEISQDKNYLRNLYCILLSLKKNNSLSFDELEKICIDRGYVRRVVKNGKE